MRVLVTGGAGFIGSHVVDHLIESGHDVVVVDDLSTGRSENVNRRARLYKEDIRSPSMREIFERERPEIVNHHAAQVNVRRSLVDPLFDAEINILGSIHLLELCRAFGVGRFIFASSGGAIYGEPSYLPCDEQHPIRPLCPYGAGKFAVETYLQTYLGAHGLDFTILRYANVYGPRQDPNGEAGVVAIFTDRMLRDTPATIFGTGEQERDFVYVTDIAKANLLVLNESQGRTYNLGSGSLTSINHLFGLIRDLTGSTREPEHAPAIPGEVFRISLNTSFAANELGWRAETSLAEGLRRTVQAFRAQLAAAKDR